MRELAESARWRDRLGGVLRGASSTASALESHDLLSHSGLDVDAWQAEYIHVLHGDDPVLEWVRGTGLRTALAALCEDDGARFSDEYGALLRDAYPRRSYGSAFPFKRTFGVAPRRG